jgi:hypothetical protein
MSEIKNNGSKRGTCLLCGDVTQPFSDLIGYIRKMHSATHRTADLTAELMIRVNDLEPVVKAKGNPN